MTAFLKISIESLLTFNYDVDICENGFYPNSMAKKHMVLHRKQPWPPHEISGSGPKI